MYKLIVFVILVTGTLASKYKCPMTMGKYPFDDKKFAGEWNIVATTTPQAKCAKMNIQPGKDGESGTYKFSGMFQNNTEVNAEIVVQPIFGKLEKASSMSLAVFNKEGKFKGPYKHIIVATDYDNYAVQLVCRPTFDEKTKTFTRELKGNILARKNLSPETLNVLKNLLTSYDIEENQITELTPDACK